MSPSTARDDVLQALVDHGGELAPAALVAATGRPERTVGRALSELRKDGLVEGPPKRPRLTAAGRQAAPALRREPTGRFEEAVEACFGETALSSFCRLGADLVVARRLYPERSFHPALFAYGAPQRGKTSAAWLLARAVGLEPLEAILQGGTLTDGAVFGRRFPDEHSPTRYRLVPAPHLSLPFFCVDEVGECDSGVRKQVQLLCHGDPVVLVEGERVRVAGTAMATWNTRERGTVFPSSYWRRSVSVLVDDVRVPDLQARMLDAGRSGAGVGTLRLDSLRRTGDSLSRACLGVLEQARGVLFEAGTARFEIRTLELLVLGRAARYELGTDADLRGLAYFVGADWLTVTATAPGLVDPGWRVPIDELAAELGDAPGMADLAKAARAHLAQREATRVAVSQRAKALAVEDLELTGDRATLVATIDQAVASIKVVPAADKARAAGIRARLATLRQRAGAARSTGGLREVVETCRPVIAEAQALRARIDYERAREAVERRRAAAEQQAAGREAKARAAADKDRERQARQRAQARAKALRRRRAELEKLSRRVKTRPGEDPAAELERLGVVRRTTVREERPVPLGLRAGLDALRGRPVERRTEQVSRLVFVDLAGRRYRPAELGTWGPPSKAALKAALWDIDAQLAGRPPASGSARPGPPAPPGLALPAEFPMPPLFAR
jgi:hypothetical protein